MHKRRFLNQTLFVCLFYDSLVFVVYTAVRLLFHTITIHSARKADQKNLLGQLANARAKLVKHDNKTRVLSDMELAKLKDKIAPQIILVLLQLFVLVVIQY